MVPDPLRKGGACGRSWPLSPTEHRQRGQLDVWWPRPSRRQTQKQRPKAGLEPPRFPRLQTAEGVKAGGFHAGGAGAAAPASSGSQLGLDPAGSLGYLGELHRIVHTTHVNMFILIRLKENCVVLQIPLT